MKQHTLLRHRLSISIGAAVLLLAFTISTLFSPSAAASTVTTLKDKKPVAKAVVVSGIVVSFKGNTLVLADPKHSKKLIFIKVTDDTLIFNKSSKKKASLKDLKLKTFVVVDGLTSKNGTIIAKGIAIVKVEKKVEDKKLAEKKKLEELEKIKEEAK